MHVLITAPGSYGDVHPMVGLGEALAKRGHQVSLIANPYFADVVLATGIELLPLGTAEQYLKLACHPDLWHPVRGQKLVFRFCGEWLKPLYDLVMAQSVPGDTVLAAHALDFASRIAAHKCKLPLASVNFSPSMFVSVHQSPRLPRGLWGDGVPRWLKRLQIDIADRVVLAQMLGPAVNGLRSEVGLPPVRRFLTQFWHDADLILALFPDWFAAPQPDWPTGMQLVGFPLWDTTGNGQLAIEVREFLASGPRPIVFTPGSANAAAADFFASAVEACQRLGQRGVLLTKFDEQLPRQLPDTVRHFHFVPLSKLLPQSAAFVHHGGIGSCAQGLAAGIPQLVRPLAFDQFDNSQRLKRLGVAAEVPLRGFTGRSVADTLARLVASSDIASCCSDLARKCDGQSALSLACHALEMLPTTASALPAD